MSLLLSLSLSLSLTHLRLRIVRAAATIHANARIPKLSVRGSFRRTARNVLNVSSSVALVKRSALQNLEPTSRHIAIS